MHTNYINASQAQHAWQLLSHTNRQEINSNTTCLVTAIPMNSVVFVTAKVVFSSTVVFGND